MSSTVKSYSVVIATLQGRRNGLVPKADYPPRVRLRPLPKLAASARNRPAALVLYITSERHAYRSHHGTHPPAAPFPRSRRIRRPPRPAVLCAANGGAFHLLR